MEDGGKSKKKYLIQKSGDKDSVAILPLTHSATWHKSLKKPSKSVLISIKIEKQITILPNYDIWLVVSNIK